MKIHFFLCFGFFLHRDNEADKFGKDVVVWTEKTEIFKKTVTYFYF